jgi:hypothetical protein
VNKQQERMDRMTILRSAVLVVVIAIAWAGCVVDDVEETQHESCNCVLFPKSCCCTTPIVLDLAGDGIELTSWQEGVEFALNPARGKEWRAWTERGSDDAWLGLPHVRPGVVTDGLELLGDVTPQPKPAPGQARNGFAALAQHDDDGDGLIDARDKVFAALRLWQDRNHDGVSTLDEMSDLKSHGITGLSVVYEEPRQPDAHGNLFRFAADVLTEPGSTVSSTAWDVSLTSPRPSERRAAGIPDPIPPSREPPAVDTQTRDVPPSSAPCLIVQAGSRPRYENGSVSGRAWWTSTGSPCPTISLGTSAKLHQWHLGEWRMLIGGSLPTASGDIVTVTEPCPFTFRSSWRTLAEYTYPPPYQGHNGSQWSNPIEHLCSAYATGNDLPPDCEQEP